MTFGGSETSVWNLTAGVVAGTVFMQVATISTNGTITRWLAGSGGAVNSGIIALKIFRWNGSNIDLVAEGGSINFGIGNERYTASCNIAVLAGDMVGAYLETWKQFCWGANADPVLWHSGNVVGTTPYSEWNSTNPDPRLGIFVTDGESPDIYVDISTGNDANDGLIPITAKTTMRAGFQKLCSSTYTGYPGQLHVASGDYSAQSGITYNKSWSLSPEDPNSTGAKNVKIAPSV